MMNDQYDFKLIVDSFEINLILYQIKFDQWNKRFQWYTRNLEYMSILLETKKKYQHNNWIASASVHIESKIFVE